MIFSYHTDHYNHLRALGAFRSPMLMLGRQVSHVGPPREFFGVTDYTTLDPDGGDLPIDLSDSSCSVFVEKFASVINLGTIEHIWDAHSAWSNALRMVRIDGWFVTVSPVGGFENHGVHITDEHFIRDFISVNGFSIEAHWLTLLDGQRIGAVDRGVGNQVLWLAARKLYGVSEFTKPQQVFREGVKL